MHERVGIERSQLYLPVRRHMERMARAAETRENGARRREVFLRFMYHDHTFWSGPVRYVFTTRAGRHGPRAPHRQLAPMRHAARQLAQ